MRIPRFLPGLFAVLAGSLAGAESRPNFLLIIADDLCWRDLGFTGNKDVKGMETEMKARTRQGAATAGRNDPEKKAGEPTRAANKAKRKAKK